MTESVDLVFREGSTELSHLSRAEPHLYLRPERPVVRAALRCRYVEALLLQRIVKEFIMVHRVGSLLKH